MQAKSNAPSYFILMIYEINHMWTAEMKWKWRNDRHSEHNLYNCVKKPEKKKKFRIPWSPEFFSGFFMQLHKLHSLLRSFLHFIFYFSQDTRIINLVFLLFLVIKIMASILLTVFPWCFWKLLHLPKVGWISSVSIKSKAGITVELATAFEVIALNFWCILNSQFPSSKTVLFCIRHYACKNATQWLCHVASLLS